MGTLSPIRDILSRLVHFICFNHYRHTIWGGVKYNLLISFVLHIFVFLLQLQEEDVLPPVL